jgi:hypothetical protein
MKPPYKAHGAYALDKEPVPADEAAQQHDGDVIATS